MVVDILLTRLAVTADLVEVKGVVAVCRHTVHLDVPLSAFLSARMDKPSKLVSDAPSAMDETDPCTQAPGPDPFQARLVSWPPQ